VPRPLETSRPVAGAALNGVTGPPHPSEPEQETSPGTYLRRLGYSDPRRRSDANLQEVVVRTWRDVRGKKLVAGDLVVVTWVHPSRGCGLLGRWGELEPANHPEYPGAVYISSLPVVDGTRIGFLQERQLMKLTPDDLMTTDLADLEDIPEEGLAGEGVDSPADTV